MITAALVKELREKTGAGMMDCKKVLTETDGDMEKAMDLLRERGIAKAAKKSGRIAAEGLVAAYVTADKKVGAIVEVNAETDFVAKNEEFVNFVNDIAEIVATNVLNSSFFATKSVSEFTSITAPTFPSSEMYASTKPSAATLPDFLAAFAIPLSRKSSAAFSKSDRKSVV